jgi:hypothetical protein
MNTKEILEELLGMDGDLFHARERAADELRRLVGMIEYALKAPQWADCLSVLHDALAGGDGADWEKARDAEDRDASN